MNPAQSIKHVLVVEDNAGDIELLNQVLAKYPWVVLHYAVNAVRARTFLLKQDPYRNAPTPDLVFLDINLPIFQGTTILPILKEIPSLRHVKVVVLTSSNRNSERDLCRCKGADDYVIKPTDWSAWQSVIFSTLIRHRVVQEPGPAVPDVDGRVVRSSLHQPRKQRSFTLVSTSVFLRLKDGRSIALKEEAEQAAALQVKAHFEQWLVDGMTLSVANGKGAVEDITPTSVVAIDVVELPR